MDELRMLLFHFRAALGMELVAGLLHYQQW